ncbi:N4-gp56 family major capsid protein [Bartonella raoultii]|uniref:N4-gp56 family major capsid protein n=1 Tax=Bartonella raoultii TaxID=1457020 RepID=UPI001ABA4182|nr:N4-gp56 family major capsid protein [Bartonella raoultii]
MATTHIMTHDPKAVKLWSQKINHEVLKATKIAPLIGKSENSIIQLCNETHKSAGDSVTFSLMLNMHGDGVTQGETLEGNEEGLQFMDDRLVINELLHAARVANNDSIDQQRILPNLRKKAKANLVRWYANRLSVMFFLQVCGYTARTINIDGREIYIKPVYYGFNEIMAPSSERIIRPDGKTKDEELTEKAKHGFSLKLIDEAVKQAKLANPQISPVHVNGDDVYVLYLHPTQVMQLRTNTAAGEWLDIQKSVYATSRAKNPIFDGSLGMYNGVVLREALHVTHGVKSTDNTAVKSVRRAVFLGAQSAIIGFGKNHSATHYTLTEKYFDYEREFGIAAKTLIGMKKTRFHMPNSAQTAQDFGTIVIPTYSGEAA